MARQTLGQRLVRIEVLMENHLRTHEKIAKYLIFPILVGVVILIVQQVVLPWVSK